MMWSSMGIPINAAALQGLGHHAVGPRRRGFARRVVVSHHQGGGTGAQRRREHIAREQA